MLHRIGSSSGLLISVAWTVLLAAPGCIWPVDDDCGTPQPPPADPSLLPIAKALHYLEFTQLQRDQKVLRLRDYAGGWPQCFSLDLGGPHVRDASPFMATFIHHALTYVNESNMELLRLREDQINAARRMRTAAVGLMDRFQAHPDDPDAGTFGFWPYKRSCRLPRDVFLSYLVDALVSGPEFMGVRSPANITYFPDDLAIQSDADVTSNVYAVLLDHALLDGGPEVTERFERFFADWRDLRQVPRRNNPDWLELNSGAFLTWLAYHDTPGAWTPNDIDLVVNANVLYCLGRYGRLDTPGADDAIRLINDALQEGVQLIDPDSLALYYPYNYALHYCVARAFAKGHVGDLAPAVAILQEDLLVSVRMDGAGHYFWDRGAPDLNTAFAVAALLYAGTTGEVIDGAVDYLISKQDDSGGWSAGPFFRGRSDDGATATWSSPAFTTAMALEALILHRLAQS
jgi:hypothetical protein